MKLTIKQLEWLADLVVDELNAVNELTEGDGAWDSTIVKLEDILEVIQSEIDKQKE